MAYYKCGSVYTTQNSNVVVDTASGAVANFQTPLAIPLLKTKFDFKATQDLHGQSGPYPVGGSAQKWDEETVNGYLSSTDGSFISNNTSICSKNFNTIEPNTDYFLFKGSSTPATYVCLYDANYDFIKREAVAGVRVTTPSNAAYFKISCYGYGATYKNDISINYPATDTAYHPYSNICPIDGWDEVKIVGCGKNLFDGVSAVYGYPFNGTIEGGNIMRVVFSRCKPNTTYTISKIQTQRFSVFWCEELPAVGVPYSGSIPDNLATSITVTTGATAKYICAFVYNQNVDTLTPEEILSSVQIEEGNATTYKSYNGSTTLINLGGTYYGGYVTQDKDGKRELVVTHKRYDLSALSWQVHQRGYYYATKPDDMYKYLSTETPEWIAEKYQKATGQWIYGHGSTIGYIGANGGLIYCTDSTTPSGYMVAPLTESIIIDLPDGQPIKSLPGINNIFADTGDTSLQFRKIG